MKDAFYEQVRGQGGTTENEKKLRAEVGELRIRVTSLCRKNETLCTAP
ncbi:MAG: hypothetical protein M3N68_05320 [Actinomycetota bacterium]|nr:hypothetical protein [Actinomycetota bacterium]